MKAQNKEGSSWFESCQIGVYISGILAGALFAVLFPAAGLVGTLLQYVLPILLFVTFLQVPLASFTKGVKIGRFILALLVGNFVFIPLLVFMLLWLGWFFLNHLWPLGHIAGGTYREGLFTTLIFYAVIVLCMPCVDYVVSFCRAARGDSASLTAALPVLLIIQYGFFLYLFGKTIMVDQTFLEENRKLAGLLNIFLMVLLLPLCLAWLLQKASGYNQTIARSTQIIKRSVVIFTALALTVIAAYAGSEIFSNFEYNFACYNEFGRSDAETCGHRNLSGLFFYGILLYILFSCFAPFAGFLTAKLFKLMGKQAIALSFSLSTRNSLVILPLLLLVSAESEKRLVAAVVLTQTFVELFAEPIYVHLIPLFVKKHF
ncbi:hypothetical protein [uncultured Bartonella sp.]|uniref:hypothetical protein n=1 Tax=uncultured Bartonella sp. TaxID=104108 RepID=UPI002632446C|nr:hypothetical protein [uncultured Bartonella sp.]